MIFITINLVSLLYLTITLFFYFSKRRIYSVENKLYQNMLIISFIGLVIDSITGIIYYNDPSFINTTVHILLVKLIFVYYLIWDLLLFYYVIITSKKKQLEKVNLNRNFINVTIIMSLLFLLLPLEMTDASLVPSGLSVLLLGVLTIVLVLAIIVILIKNFKSITNKKYLPLLLFLILGIATIFAQIASNLLLMSALDCFITILMYHTIENPDILMIEELELAREQADKANNVKTDFLSNMSHEIRTPLNAIVGFSQNLYEENIPDSAKDQVKDIISASDSLLEIVNGILDISKIEANKLEIINDEYSFQKIFTDLVSLAKVRLGDKDIIFRTSYDESIPKVLYGDKLRVKQVVLNILTNSVKYTKKGFIEFKVNSVIKDDICRLIISVEDSGVGIKKENIDKLFTKFQRFEERNTTIEGTGLGLAITKKLVDLMGGRIVVQSVYGQGSKFTIAIDQKIVKNPTIKLDVNNREVGNETFDLTGKKVLVVDDNKLNLKVASKLLEKYNLTVEVLSSGFECLEKINNKEFYDLILMDDMMPKMSGVETLNELRKIEGFNIPVVILTANAISGMREKYINDGFDDYLAKPIEKEELNRVLKGLLLKQ